VDGRAIVVGALAAIGLPCAACSIDENGLLGDASVDEVAVDAPIGDAGGDVGDGAVGCTTIDASCIGVPIPIGWQPFAMQVDASTVTCPGDGGDFAELSYQANPVVVGNSCVCTPCSVATGWNCSGSLGANGGSCNGTTQAVGDTSFCWSMTGTSGGATVTRVGTATCASTYYATTASATSVAGCAPKNCEADFCGLAKQGFKLCARNPGVTDGGCPPGFPVSYVAGANPHAACNACPACSVINSTATCTAALSGYTSADCTTGYFASGVDGTCYTNVNFNSVLYQPTVPVPVCNLSGPTNVGGTGEVDSPVTVCCTK
jgi:hypothetical protein